MEDFKQSLEQINLFLKDEFESIQIHKEFNQSKNNYHLLSEKGKYFLEILNLYGRLNKLLEDLNFVEVFITTYKEKDIYKESEINEIKYINYHLEVFYHKISTILDVIKLFVSHVFELGIPQKDCNWENIKEKKADIDSEVYDLIERYHESFKSIIKIRNLNTHRSINVNPNSNQIANLLYLQENTDTTNNELKDFISNKQISSSLKKHKSKKVEDLRNIKEIAKKYIGEFKGKILIEALKRADNK